MDIEDHLGKPLAALEVFSKSLNYMREEVLKKLRCTVKEKKECKDVLITAENIHWIVTVPAIWDDYAKKFMRDAAEKVNIPSLIYFTCSTAKITSLNLYLYICRTLKSSGYTIDLVICITVDLCQFETLKSHFNLMVS